MIGNLPLPGIAQHYRHLRSGIVVDDVVDVTNMIHTKYHVPYFPKGPQLADFAVMGDAGACLSFQKGRGWLPTQKRAN